MRLDEYGKENARAAWLDAAIGLAALHEAAEAVLGETDEYVIHEVENFAGLQLSPSASLTYVAEVAGGIREHGPAFAHWARLVQHRIEFLQDFKSHYFGYWPTPADWAAEFMKDLGLLQELAPLTAGFRPYLYVDYAGFAQDMRDRGELTWRGEAGGVHIFLTPWRLGDLRDEPEDDYDAGQTSEQSMGPSRADTDGELQRSAG
jgi:antirestriction protein